MQGAKGRACGWRHLFRELKKTVPGAMFRLLRRLFIEAVRRPERGVNSQGSRKAAFGLLRALADFRQPIQQSGQNSFKFVGRQPRNLTLDRRQTAGCHSGGLVANHPRKPPFNACSDTHSPRIIVLRGRTHRQDGNCAVQGSPEGDHNDWPGFPELREMRVFGKVAPINGSDFGCSFNP